MSGGPGTKDPGYFVCDNCPLSRLLFVAYRIQRYQLTGPAWLNERRFDVAAKVPQGSSRDDFRSMLQNLLAERFNCATHWDSPELPVYRLVEERGGHKFKETEPAPSGLDSAAAGTKTTQPGLGKDGYPDLTGHSIESAMIGHRVRLRLTNASIADLVLRLEAQVSLPVIDATTLQGHYNFSLSWIADQAVAASSTVGGEEP